jgi:lysyl-tRNA synthetase class 2
MSIRPLLERRARVRRAIASLFDARGFVEVDTPVLASEVVPEAHIDPIRVPVGDTVRYLQASPELLMKRLLAAGSGPIYQFARAFREGERGRQHDVEFVLLEWYAPGESLEATVDLLAEIGAAVLGTRGIERVSCREAFLDHAGVDPLTADAAALEAALDRLGIPRPAGAADADERRDRGFELLLAEVVQPRLGHGRPALLEQWPASQAALGRVRDGTPPVAERFELFVAGVELANGWVEETDRDIVAARLEAANRVRCGAGRAPLPLPTRLLDVHGGSLPEGVGVALGFDRLVMLAAAAASIDAVRPFSSQTA